MNICGVKKVSTYLAIPLALVGFSLAAWNNAAAGPDKSIDTDTRADLAAYRKAVELDPDNADSWNRLGHLLRRTGEPEQAEEAYLKAFALGEAHQDEEEQAQAYANLGDVYWAYSDLDQAEAFWQRSLELFQATGHPDAGKVQQSLDELDHLRSSTCE
ncbi:MAG: tetratricopeptide repeat protein [Candidatus Electrothrix sp. YB6]